MTNIDHSRREGSCLCRAVTFVTEGEPVIVAHCYCRDCQHVTGAGHSTGAMFASANVRLSGSLGEFDLESDAGSVVTRAFCRTCGSPVVGRNTGMPGFLTISLGLFDAPGSFEPTVAIFARSRCAWDHDAAGVVAYDDQPRWRPQ